VLEDERVSCSGFTRVPPEIERNRAKRHKHDRHQACRNGTDELTNESVEGCLHGQTFVRWIGTNIIAGIPYRGLIAADLRR